MSAAPRPAPAADLPPLTAARLAVSAVFFLNGAGTANWVVRIPAVRDHVGLGDPALGVALLGVAAGALVAMPVAGRLVARHGSRPVTRAGAVAFAAALALPALAPSLTLLALALVALGAGGGVLGVAMNAQAAAVERRYGRPIMSRFHALFSLGGLAGAAFGGLAAEAAVPASHHLALVALAVGVAAAGSATGMLPAAADAAPEQARFTRPSRPLVVLGVVAFCVLFGEGAMADWGAVYLRDVTGAGAGAAAAGYAAFSLMMALGRAVGDALAERFEPARLVAGGGVLAACGVAAALAAGAPWGAVAGFGLVGAGLSVVFPTVLTAAGRVPGAAAGPAIAAVSTFGYAGFLAGPPLIGFLAHAFTLRGGLAAVAATSVAVAALGGVIGRAEGAPDEAADAAAGGGRLRPA